MVRRERHRSRAPACVSRIDAAAHKAVHCDDGNVGEPYDKLIIATGSRPFVPPIEALRTTPTASSGAACLSSARSMIAEKIAEYAASAAAAAVIGGGLLGLEAARGLLNSGVEVHVVHLMGHLMEQQLDPERGRDPQGSMEKLGIHVHLKKTTDGACSARTSVTGLAFADEATTLECDMVVISAGISPNCGNRPGCGPDGRARHRGRRSDAHLDDPDIYAVGECAQHRGQRYGLVAPLWEQAKVLADHITGANPDAAYHGSKSRPSSR